MTAPKKIQREGMDLPLKNRLWHTFITIILEDPALDFGAVISELWMEFYKRPKDETTRIGIENKLYQILRRAFFTMQWFEVYDFIEFICQYTNSMDEVKGNVPIRTLDMVEFKDYHSKRFIDACNRVLEQENSAYRIVGNSVVEVTSEIEIKEIEKAQQTTMESVNGHFGRALELLADRRKPDYNSSIRESISAVESVCRKIVGNDKLTLGKALEKMGKMDRFNFHSGMIGAFDKLYGYTSADTGIRHAKQGNEKNIPLEEAKFFLVACSAFVNYLVALCGRHRVNLK